MRDDLRTLVEFLKDNQSYRVGDIRVGITEQFEIEVTGWSNYIHFENLTKLNCLQELKEIKKIFFKMIDVSDDLKNFVAGKTIIYNLGFDHYGKSSIAICMEKDGEVVWRI